MTAREQQLHSALTLTVTPKGHHPDCPHRQWRGDWDNRSRHECDVEGCDRTGQPCSKRCAQIRQALRIESPALALEGAG
jgi:hypothetical protein